MKIAMFDTHGYDRDSFTAANVAFRHEITFLEPRLTATTASLAAGHDAVCAFVNDRADERTLEILAEGGAKLLALRSAGFNHVDLSVAERLGIRVVRVPAYSPYAVAEHAVALVLGLNRKIHRASARVREWNFSLDGLVGFDLRGKTVGIIGTGRIGQVAVEIFRGFGCRVLCYDAFPDEAFASSRGASYVELSELYAQSDIVSLHLPLTPETHHMIDSAALSVMKHGAMMINTSRGALIDSRALVRALKSGKLGAAGLDVYEEEAGIFFQDLSNKVLQDDILARLLSFPNVLVTSHQAFMTVEALSNIAHVTLENVRAFESGQALVNEVKVEEVFHSSEAGSA
ncbi:MAG TPA: 2-hydroxyacid dehydrogenase [Polyangiaceae bacterium]|nr:2-hydroxyacid dehydrogenase [Polyangiaceae bacterium]